MSDNSAAVAVASPNAIENPGAWRNLLSLLATPFTALWRSWSAPDVSLEWYQLSDQELIDAGASPEQLAEAQAMREFEFNRAYALSMHHW